MDQERLGTGKVRVTLTERRFPRIVERGLENFVRGFLRKEDSLKILKSID